MTNAHLLCRWFEELWNQRRFEIIDELVAPGARLEAGSTVLVGAAEFRAFAQEVHETFSDIRMTVEHTIEEGDFVALRWTVSQAHTGKAWLGIAPQGRRVTITGMTMAQFRNGKIVAGWENWDMAGLAQQLHGWPLAWRTRMYWPQDSRRA